MEDKTLRKQIVTRAVDACGHHFQVTLHDQALEIHSDEEETGDILTFLFGRQARVAREPNKPSGTRAEGWRIGVVVSDEILHLWKHRGEIEATGMFSELKSYWRPDFPSAFLELAPDLTVVRHKAPFTGLTILLAAKRLLVYVRPSSEPAFIPHIETMAGYLWRCAMWNAGFLDLHSAMVRYRGFGMAIIGPKMAGKTSLAMHFLAHNAQLLGSDFGEVTVAPDGRLQARAVPHICRITPETVTDNVLLSQAIDTSSLPNSAYRAGPVFSLGKFEFFAPGLDHIFGRGVNITSMAVDFLIFPKFSRDVKRQRITPIADQIAKTKLAESIRHDRPLADWLPFPEVQSRKARETSLLEALVDVPVRAYQVEFGQEPSLDWTELNTIIETSRRYQLP